MTTDTPEISSAPLVEREGLRKRNNDKVVDEGVLRIVPVDLSRMTLGALLNLSAELTREINRRLR